MLNRAILMGRLTADPELRTTSGGVSVTSFTVAVNRNYNREQTDFIDVVAWRQTAEFVSKYFRKGQMIAVEGAIQTRSYEDKNGNKRKAVEIVADQVHFTESKNSSNAAAGNGYTGGTGYSAPARKPDTVAEPANGTAFTIGDIGDFEEIEIDDGELPF